jgi:SAM-dependent methyltransferase
MSGTYADVDNSADPGQALLAQEVIDSWPQIGAYKRRTYELLAAHSPVLDVGCGPGFDLLEIRPARAVGVDASHVMSAAAHRRGPVACADARRLPFGDGCFGGTRADRVLQHIEDPEGCLAEMVRVCRRGGRVVVADPDQETLSIAVPGIPREMADRVKRLRRDVGYRNGRLVATLPSALTELGLTDVSVDAFPLVITNAEDAFGLRGWPRLWRDEAASTTRRSSRGSAPPQSRSCTRSSISWWEQRRPDPVLEPAGLR